VELTATALAYLIMSLSLVVAAAGVVLPILPGVPLAAVGAVLAAWVRGFGAVGLEPLLWTVALAALAQLLDLAAAAWGARVYGSGRAGLWGGAAGSLIGLLAFPPLGFLFGALAGAFLAELWTGRAPSEALRAGVGALIGTVGGTVAKLVIVIVMAFVMLPALQ
jgi:uncharacterized protein YqgC (DUF456 family)